MSLKYWRCEHREIRCNTQRVRHTSCSIHSIFKLKSQRTHYINRSHSLHIKQMLFEEFSNFATENLNDKTWNELNSKHKFGFVLSKRHTNVLNTYYLHLDLHVFIMYIFIMMIVNFHRQFLGTRFHTFAGNKLKMCIHHSSFFFSLEILWLWEVISVNAIPCESVSIGNFIWFQVFYFVYLWIPKRFLLYLSKCKNVKCLFTHTQCIHLF